jgi:hypothetical protein
VLGELRLEHAVDHVEPAARLRDGARVEALLDRVEDDRLDGVGDVLVAEAAPTASALEHSVSGSVEDEHCPATPGLGVTV